MNKLRQFLKDNKIFFETIAALALSVMAIFVSFAELKIYETQTAIQEQTVLPHFVIAARQKKLADNENKYDNDEITIENLGAPVSEFDARVIVLYDLKLDNKSYKTLLNGYYGSRFLSPGGTGNLGTIKDYKNNTRQIQIENDFRETARNRNANVDLNVERYLRIEYHDLLRRKHTEYYYVALIHGGRRIQDHEGEHIFVSENKCIASMQFVEFSRISGHDLFMDAEKINCQQLHRGVR